MSNKDLVLELKAHIKDLTAEKDELNKALSAKDGRIKQLLLKIEDANTEVQSMAKKLTAAHDECRDMKTEIADLQKKLTEAGHSEPEIISEAEVAQQDESTNKSK